MPAFYNRRLMRIDGWGVMLLIWVGAFIPWLAWRTSRRLSDRALPIGRPQFEVDQCRTARRRGGSGTGSVIA
jgi:hypothetical protein